MPQTEGEKARTEAKGTVSAESNMILLGSPIFQLGSALSFTTSTSFDYRTQHKTLSAASDASDFQLARDSPTSPCSP